MMHKSHAQQQLGEEQRRCQKHIFDPKLPNRYRSLASIFLGSYTEQLPPKLEVLTKILSYGRDMITMLESISSSKLLLSHWAYPL